MCRVSTVRRYLIRGHCVVYMSKETYVCEKRPTKQTYKTEVSTVCRYLIRGCRMSKETYVHEKRLKYLKRDVEKRRN